MSLGGTPNWWYLPGSKDIQHVQVIAWTDSGAVVVATERGELPIDQPSLVRLSNLRVVWEPPFPRYAPSRYPATGGNPPTVVADGTRGMERGR